MRSTAQPAPNLSAATTFLDLVSAMGRGDMPTAAEAHGQLKGMGWHVSFRSPEPVSSSHCLGVAGADTDTSTPKRTRP